jgi:hypothetical protein
MEGSARGWIARIIRWRELTIYTEDCPCGFDQLSATSEAGSRISDGSIRVRADRRGIRPLSARRLTRFAGAAKFLKRPSAVIQ